LRENLWEKALPYLLEAENFDKAAEIIAEKGGELIAGGAIITLDGFIEKISPEVLEKHPRAILHKAEIARLRGETDKSSNLLNRAVRLLAAESDKTGEAEALQSLASLARRKGDHAAALDLLEKAENLVDEDTETFLKCANTRGLCLIAQGAWAPAEQQFRFALELAEKQSNEQYIRLITHNLALPAGFRGDFGEALRWFRRIFRDDRNEKPLPQEAIGHLNVARLYLYRGEFGETEKHLERALELCRLYNMKSLRGEIFEAYGNFYRDKNDFSHAAEFYERAQKSFEEANVELATRELDEERARFYLLRGDPVKARALLENLVLARRKLNNAIGLKTAELALCRVRLAQGETSGLATEIKHLTEFFHDQNLNYDEANASMLLAETYFAGENLKEMMPPLQRALDLAARFDYEHWLRGEIRRNPRLFADEEVIEKLPLDLRQDVNSHESGVLSHESKSSGLQTHDLRLKTFAVVDLTIKTFGFVEVFRDRSKPFAADAWTTKRARDIFCYIATSRHRRVDKEVLIEAFWGDEDFAAIEKNFHPTISHIRKALNSRQSYKQNFLVFRDGAYQLNAELSYSIDTEEFEAAVTQAEHAKREKDAGLLRESLQRANEIYRGEFLAGIYEDWAEERRNFYTEQHSRVLNGLAKLAFAEKSWPNALKFANQILQRDPFREDAHRLIMKTYAAQGKRASVVEQFETLQTLLKKELGVAPAPETRRIFQELTK
jgi:DNA-binding SARP family transcriptional activator